MLLDVVQEKARNWSKGRGSRVRIPKPASVIKRHMKAMPFRRLKRWRPILSRDIRDVDLKSSDCWECIA